MGTKDQRVKRIDGVVTQEVNKELLVYDLENHKAFCLNETSALVYQLCDGDLSVPEISARMSAQLKKPVSEDFVWLAIDQLQKDSLVETGSDAQVMFSAPSRRDVIRKIGLASLIALPLVTGIVAPPAANAASTCAPSACSCGTPGIVASCTPAPGTCQNACICQIPNPGNCVADGFGGFTCTGTCG